MPTNSFSNAPVSNGVSTTPEDDEANTYLGVTNGGGLTTALGSTAPAANYVYGASSVNAPTTNANLSQNSAGQYNNSPLAALEPNASSSYYDPGESAYNYNGVQEGDFDAMGQAAQSRENLINTTQTTADQGQNALAAQQQQAQLGTQQGAYGTQQQAANLALGQANGTAPSVAQAQLQSGLDSSNQAASSLAAGARGSGTGLAQILAQQQQGTNNLATNNQAAQLRANEIQQGTAAYNSAAQGLSSSANAMSGTAANIRSAGQSQQAQDAQQAQAQATATQASRNANDSYQNNEQQLGQNASKAQQTGAMGYYGNEGANYNAQSATNAGLSASNAQTTGSLVSAGASAVGAGLIAIGSDARAKTGIQSLTLPSYQSPSTYNTPGQQQIGAAINAPQYSYGGPQMPQQAAQPTPGMAPGGQAPTTTRPIMDQQPTQAFGSDPSAVASQPGGSMDPNAPSYGQAQWNAQRAQTNTMPGTSSARGLPYQGGSLQAGFGNLGSGLGALIKGQQQNPSAIVSDARAKFNMQALSQPVAAGANQSPTGNALQNAPPSDPFSGMAYQYGGPTAAGANQAPPGNALNPASYGTAAKRDDLAQPVAPNHRIGDAQAASLAKQADSMQQQMAYQYGGPQGVAPPANDPSPQVGSFLNSLQPYSFEYRDPRLDPTDPGQHYGVMAQNVASTPMGASLIDRSKGGALAIDVKRALPAALAGEADLNERVRQLEASQQSAFAAPGMNATAAAYRYGGGR